jgi:NADPH:quinone reductase-like Zn-dependent oxidoreductase
MANRQSTREGATFTATQPRQNSLTALTEAGSVTPVIDRTYALADAPDAMRYLAQGHPAGKVVVTV